ncbi:MAG: hypothetical protein LC799_18420, partial [Actinobacteria bacterium]|nr:hypothetical protein [Actinomycetota bacterium]
MFQGAQRKVLAFAEGQFGQTLPLPGKRLTCAIRPARRRAYSSPATQSGARAAPHRIKKRRVAASGVGGSS